MRPPLKRLPSRAAWLCPGCVSAKKAEKEQEKAARREQRKRERYGPGQLSAGPAAHEQKNEQRK
jgi:hypothetical protein